MVFTIRMSRRPELNFTYLRLYYLDQPRLAKYINLIPTSTAL
jgi:hypothetical protein